MASVAGSRSSSGSPLTVVRSELKPFFKLARTIQREKVGVRAALELDHQTGQPDEPTDLPSRRVHS